MIASISLNATTSSTPTAAPAGKLLDHACAEEMAQLKRLLTRADAY